MSAPLLNATDPRSSAVVQACAGSGKTWLLTTRIFRLLLDGASVDEILAITFTRKAAQEMRERIEGLVRECALLDDRALDELLAQRGVAPSEQSRFRARTLVDSVFDAPRGLAIDTFHGWFASLCQLAPLQLGFSRQAEPTDEVEFLADAVMFECIQTLSRAWLQSDRGQDNPQARAYDTLLNMLGKQGVVDVLHTVLKQRSAYLLWCNGRTAEELAAAVWEDFGFDDPQRTGVVWPEALFSDTPGPTGGCPLDLYGASLRACALGLARRLGEGTKTAQDKAIAIERAVAHQDPVLLKSVFFNAKGEPLSQGLALGKKQLDTLTEQAIADHASALSSVRQAISQAEVIALQWREATVTAALVYLMPEVLRTYEDTKRSMGVCDFDDLEMVAHRLLHDPQAAPYVLSKLERRTRHVLLDEFQDTNPLQWAILKTWLEQYTDTHGRTVFMVGDPKQSIYRFRRAEAALFDEATQWLVAHLGAHVYNTDASRRCSTPVVNAVNAVFTAHRMGTTEIRPHTSVAPVIVEGPWAGLTVLPLVPRADGALAAEPDEEDGLGEAQSLARSLQHLHATGVFERWSDCMVLVRAHSDAVPVSRALQALGIPHGLKEQGGRFTSPLWTDVVALLKVLQSPHNDASLLAVLTSPLLGWQARDVQILANLPGHSVWARLSEGALGKKVIDPLWVEKAQRTQRDIATWVGMARGLPLFEVLRHIVKTHDAVSRYMAVVPATERMRAQTHWDWVLAWSLDLRGGRFPDLGHAIEEAEKRARFPLADSDSGGLADQVSVLTVHSAKGLEARYVWLYASHKGGPARTEWQCLFDWPMSESAPLHFSMTRALHKVDGARRQIASREMGALRNEADHLLYVALTRAKEGVFMSGAEPGRALSLNGRPTWHEWAMQAAPAQSALDFGRDGSAVRILHDWAALLDKGELSSIATGAVDEPMIEWTAPQALPALPFVVGEAIDTPDTPELRMGIAWHAWMERVTAHTFVDRACWIQATAPDIGPPWDTLPESEKSEVLGVMDRLLDAKEWVHAVFPECCPAIGSGLPDPDTQAWSELEWVTTGGDLLRADRVVRQGTRFTVFDFKWTVHAGNLPSYAAQVKTYAGLVQQTFPECEHVACVLLSADGKMHVVQ